MGTGNYDLPLISGSASAKVPRDLNALANAVDAMMKNESVKIQFDKNFELMKYKKYGAIALPSDFMNNINFTIYRDVDGKMKHDFNIDAHLSNWNATYLYLSQTGTTGNDGLTPATPKNTLQACLDLAHSRPETHFVIKILSKYVDKDRSLITNNVITKNIAIVADEEAYIGNVNNNTSWTLENGVYRYARSQVRSIYDNKYKVTAGLPKEYVKTATLTECQAKKGSFYTDNVTVYVNTFDSRMPDADVLLSLGTSAIAPYVFALNADVQFVMKNVHSIQYFEGSHNLRFESTGVTKGHVILHNVKLIESGNNGLMTNGVKNIWSFGVVATKTKRDGLNYHNTLTGDHFVLEYNCTAFECGVNDTNNNNNCTTAHEGAYVLRVNTKGWLSRGPLLADINGCYTILYDCNMTESLRSAHPSDKAAYQFANGAFGTEGKGLNGKAIMVNCEGGGTDTLLLSTANSFAAIQVLNLIGDFKKMYNANLVYLY